jgi:branched-chain amino acid transport system substrate-binding protein
MVGTKVFRLGVFFTLLVLIAPLRAEILVGFAGPLTGPRAWSGQQFQRGAEQAVVDINAAGGVLGQQLTLIVGDDASDPQQAQAVANKLIDDGASLIIGHRSSDMTAATLEIYATAKVVQITPSSTNPTLTERGINSFFRVTGRDDDQGLLAGDYMKQHWADRSIGIIHDESSYGIGLARHTRARLNQLGINAVFFAEFKAGLLDYGDLLDQIRQQDIEVLYIGGYSAESALIIRQARDAGMDVQLVSGDALHNSDFWLIAGSAGVGSVFTFDVDPRTRAEAKSLVKHFRAEGYEPEGYTLHTYAALQVWVAAVEKAGSTDHDAVVNIMHASSFDTVLGKIEFDEKGDLTRHDYTWYIWEEGQPVRQ